MAAADATTTLTIGSMVLANDYRHPVVVAKEAATVDLLSGGRLELGIGAGWTSADYEAAGFALDRPGVRIARLDESIQVLRGLWGERAVHVPRRALPHHRPGRDARARPAPGARAWWSAEAASASSAWPPARPTWWPST